MAPEARLDELVAWDNLTAAWEDVADNRGSHGPDLISIDRFARNWAENLQRLRELVTGNQYRPGRLRQCAIPKKSGGYRVLSIPNVGDRVLQRAALNVLEPRFERKFLSCSFGYRPGRGVRNAVAALVRLRTMRQTWVFEADIDDCFDSIDHRLLLALIAEEALDPPLQRLLRQWIHAGRRRTDPDRGLAQGMPICPLLCNLYLHQMDQTLTRGRWFLVRYADDFVVCCNHPDQAVAARDAVEKALARLHLRLDPAKCRISSFARGFEFLGVQFEGDAVRVVWQDKPLTLHEHSPEWVWRQLPEGYGSE